MFGSGDFVSSLLDGQSSLFGHEEPAAPSLESVRRRELSRGAWVDHAPCWLQGDEELFVELAERVPWTQHRRPMYDRYVDVPRLIGQLPDFGRCLDVVSQVQQRLTAGYGVEFDRVGVALYRDGDDSVAWHGDQVARERPQALVATVSLGEPRTFALRPTGGGARLDYRLGHGDLLVMGGTCQRTWEHCVPKVRRAGPRIALMFRPSSTSSSPITAARTQPGWYEVEPSPN